MSEVAVARAQHELMFDDQRRNPKIVGGNRCALGPQLAVEVGVGARRGLGREERFDARLVQEASEDPLVFATSRPDLDEDEYRSRLWLVDLTGDTPPRARHSYLT